MLTIVNIIIFRPFILHFYPHDATPVRLSVLLSVHHKPVFVLKHLNIVLSEQHIKMITQVLQFSDAEDLWKIEMG